MKLAGSVLAAAAALFATSANAEVYMKETFEDAEWESRWTVGTEWKPTSQTGEWKWMTPELHEDGKAIQTGEDARFYSLTAPLDAEVNNEGKDLIISYTVKHEQSLDCGGAYIKLVPPGFEASKFGGDTPYSVMFGPDICGTSTRKTHAIFTYKGDNLLTKRTIRCETDKLSHRYTLIVHPDNTYAVKIDGKTEASGSLLDDWDFLGPKEIKDPEQSKPADWVDDAKIPDPEASKPDGWDNEPAQVPDADAAQPEDWDEEEDGEWEPPMIDNPEYKGEWKAPMIDNPDYVGPWVHPMVANPDYVEDDKVYNVCNPCSHVGFELWQVKAGTAFDDIFVGDDEAELEAFEKETWEVKKAAETKANKAKQAAEAEKAAEAAKKAEEEAAAAADDEDDAEDEEEEEL